MPDVSSHPVGSFSWVELATSDSAAAVSFYRDIFGWDIVEHDMGPDGVYTIFTMRGRDVAASAGQHPEERRMGIPPHWNLYVAVDDADAAAKKLETLGGKVDMAPFDVMEHGRMAVVQDPTGAMFDRVKANGGNLMIGPAPIPGAGRFAIVTDPQGAMFAVFQGE